jgi:hypothetical protein
VNNVFELGKDKMRLVISSFLLLLLALNAQANLTKNDIQEIEKLLDKHDDRMKQYKAK